uniref:Uncharacterized protein n=1 Tax=Anopheles coluzzii TaxID=1518534 RepID=A0A8W7PW82_ANOCL
MNGIGFAVTIAHSGQAAHYGRPLYGTSETGRDVRTFECGPPCAWRAEPNEPRRRLCGGARITTAQGEKLRFATTTYAKRCRQCVTRARTAFGSNSYWAYGGPSGWNRPCSDDGSDAESFGEARDDAVRSVPPLPACFGWAWLRFRANRSSDAISEQSDTCMG